MEAGPFERSPVQGVLVLLIGTALYTVLLPQAIALGAALQTPGLLTSLIGDPHVRFWVWDQLLHTLAVLLTSLPFAWVLSRLYTKRLLPAALLLVIPTVIWMVLDYLSLRQEIPDAPATVNVFYALDALKIVLILPLLGLLLRPRAAGGRR